MVFIVTEVEVDICFVKSICLSQLGKLRTITRECGRRQASFILIYRCFSGKNRPQHVMNGIEQTTTPSANLLDFNAIWRHVTPPTHRGDVTDVISHKNQYFIMPFRVFICHTGNWIYSKKSHLILSGCCFSIQFYVKIYSWKPIFLPLHSTIRLFALKCFIVYWKNY